MTLNRSHTGALTPDQEVSPKLGSRGSGPRAFTMQPKPEFKTATLIPSAQSILDALTVAVALLDRDGTIVAVNQGWRTFARQRETAPITSSPPTILRSATMFLG